MYKALMGLGLSYDDCEALRRCSMTLHRWAERECGDDRGWCIERDEQTGKPFSVYYGGMGKPMRYPIADREAGAIRRAKRILMEKGLTLYHQGDCRGAAIYVLRPSDMDFIITEGLTVDSCYTSGIAVY